MLDSQQNQYQTIVQANSMLREENQKLVNENRIYAYQIQNTNREVAEDLIRNSSKQERKQPFDLLQEFLGQLEQDLAQSRIACLGLKEELNDLQEVNGIKQKENLVLNMRIRELARDVDQLELQKKLFQTEKDNLREELQIDFKNRYVQMEKENYESRQTIVNLQNQVLTQQRLAQQQVQPSISHIIQGAIKELALVILSKDKQVQLDDNTKLVIKELFGENFSKIVNSYESTIHANKQEFSQLQTRYDILTDQYKAVNARLAKHQDIL